MPAKSGVSGCIMAVIPGQLGIGVYSPPLDAQGNSVRGIKVCQDISNEFELHAFNNRTNVRSVIRRFYRGDRVRSSRLRTAEERDLLEAQGDKIAVIETQGALFFGSDRAAAAADRRDFRERALCDRRFQARAFGRRLGAQTHLAAGPFHA